MVRDKVVGIMKPTIAEVLAEFLEEQRPARWRLVEAWNVYPS